MGRGKDLTSNERTTVHSLIKKCWSYDLNQFKHKGRLLTRKDCLEYGAQLSEVCIKKYAQEMKAQEAFAKSEWKRNRRVACQNFSANRKGRRGRPSLLTNELKESYRKTIERHAYSWRRLSIRKLRSELRWETGHELRLRTAHERLRRMKSKHKAIRAKPTLSAANKKQRVQCCMGAMDKSRRRDRVQFRLDMNSFHVDESWLYVTQLEDYDRCIDLLNDV